MGISLQLLWRAGNRLEANGVHPTGEVAPEEEAL